MTCRTLANLRITLVSMPLFLCKLFKKNSNFFFNFFKNNYCSCFSKSKWQPHNLVTLY